MSAYNSYTDDEFFNQIYLARNTIKNDPEINIFAGKFLQECGFPARETYIDAVRLRAATPGFHLLEKTKSVSFIHRDGWYANPQGQINIWVPVFDVEDNRTFGIYAEYITKPIENNSRLFDYEDWLIHGGFQSLDKNAERGKIFPSPKKDPDIQTAFKVTAKANEAIFFAGNHLHGTLPNTSDVTRYTLEIRMITSEILQNNLGMVNLDNRSSGTTLYDFYNPNGHTLPDASMIKEYVRHFAWDKP